MTRRRRFAGLWALMASLALHAAVFALLIRFSRPDLRALRPELAGAPATRVVLFDAVSVPLSSAAPVRSQPAAAPRREPVRPVKALRGEAPPAPPPEAPAASDPVEAPEVAPAQPASAPEGAGGPVANPKRPSTPTLPGSGVSGSNGGAAPSAGNPSEAARGAPMLAALHQRLQAAVARCYPEAAVRLRARGRVVVSFCLDAGGNATSVTREASSGSALLDRAATDCVVPGALPAPGAPGCYSVPVVFGGQ